MSNQTKNVRIGRLRHLIYAVLLIFADQLTKYLARMSFADGSDFPLIPGVLRFLLHKNTGAVWGIFSKTENSVLYLTVATFVVLAGVIFIYFKIPDTKRYTPILLIVTFIFSGAIGNLIDRIFLSYVTDFIYFELINFPVFNVADGYITVSVFVLCFFIIFKYDDRDFDFLFHKKSRKES